MRVLDDAEDIAKWIEDGSDPNAIAHFLHHRARRRAEGNQAFKTRGGIGYSPVSDGPMLASRGGGSIGIETQLITADVVANVEGLVEVRLETKD